MEHQPHYLRHPAKPTEEDKARNPELREKTLPCLNCKLRRWHERVAPFGDPIEQSPYWQCKICSYVARFPETAPQKTAAISCAHCNTITEHVHDPTKGRDVWTCPRCSRASEREIPAPAPKPAPQPEPKPDRPESKLHVILKGGRVIVVPFPKFEAISTEPPTPFADAIASRWIAFKAGDKTIGAVLRSELVGYFRS